jgi:hypothetical protein
MGQFSHANPKSRHSPVFVYDAPASARGIVSGDTTRHLGNTMTIPFPDHNPKVPDIFWALWGNQGQQHP